ncbi:hypothetical protein OQA88_5926 [Cercophora sp. LCS_1]
MKGYPLEIDDDELSEGNHDDDTTSAVPDSDSGDQPMAAQWAAIRTLREETEFHHKKFVDLASSFHDPIISKLLDDYPDSKSIRGTGAQLFKDILSGFQPRTLSHVFAFTSFSYSMSQLLYKDGRLDKIDVLADLKSWRDLISDTKEKHAFNRLAPELWPESKEHLHFIDVPGPVNAGLFPFGSFDPQPLNPVGSAGSTLSQAPWAQDIGNLGFPSGSAGGLEDHVGYSQGFSSPSTQDLAVATQVLNMTMNVHEQYNFSAIDPGTPFSSQPPPDDAEWMAAKQPAPDIQGPFPTQPPPPFEPREASADRNAGVDVSLEKTMMFLVVLIFLQDVGELLYILSGRSLASRRHHVYAAEQALQQRFFQDAQETFFKPCYQGINSNFPTGLALLAVAETFTKDGYLRSVAEIKHYLGGVASAVFPPGDLYEGFSSVILCPSAMTQPKPLSKSRKRQRSRDAMSGDDASFEPRKRTGNHVCQDCGAEGYSDRSALRKHQMQKHPKKSPIRCAYGACKYESQRRDRVREHFRKLHPGAPLPERLRKK